MSYRPITDLWFLARAKLKDGRKYYGAYLGGFPERARALLGVTINDPVLHVCGGMAKYYPYKNGFGQNDKTLDIDPVTEPDIRMDVNHMDLQMVAAFNFRAFLCDPPYSEQDAEHYNSGAAAYPNPNKLVQNCINMSYVGCRVGIIHYVVPRCPKNARFVAEVGVVCGFGNRIRAYSVFERTE